MVSAPRPASPPVKRVTATRDEEDNALEYGLPSSHTLNTVCLSGYLLFSVFICFLFLSHPTRFRTSLAGMVTERDYEVCLFRVSEFLCHVIKVHIVWRDGC